MFIKYIIQTFNAFGSKWVPGNPTRKMFPVFFYSCWKFYSGNLKNVPWAQGFLIQWINTFGYNFCNIDSIEIISNKDNFCHLYLFVLQVGYQVIHLSDPGVPDFGIVSID